MPACLACRSERVTVGPRSRATGRCIVACRECHAHFLSEPPKGAQVDTLSIEEFTDGDYSDWVDLKREDVGPAAWRAAAEWLRSVLADVPEPVLYDVGAGDGAFLAMARDEFGFRVTGNDVVEGAVALAKKRYSVDLDFGDLATVGHDATIDAVTMWCVLAHVPDGEALLRDVHRMLRPGGLVHLQTPHWTGADSAAYGLQRLTRGRVSKLPDRRVAEHHSILHTRRSITALLTRLGFVDVVAEPQLRYTLTSEAYLASMNPPAWTLRPSAWLMDRAIASPLAPRIVLDVRARRDG